MAHQDEKITQLKSQLQNFLDHLNELDPSKTSVEDIDRLILMVENMEQDLPQ